MEHLRNYIHTSSFKRLSEHKNFTPDAQPQIPYTGMPQAYYPDAYQSPVYEENPYTSPKKLLPPSSHSTHTTESLPAPKSEARRRKEDTTIPSPRNYGKNRSNHHSKPVARHTTQSQHRLPSTTQDLSKNHTQVQPAQIPARTTKPVPYHPDDAAPAHQTDVDSQIARLWGTIGEDEEFIAAGTIQWECNIVDTPQAYLSSSTAPHLIAEAATLYPPVVDYPDDEEDEPRDEDFVEEDDEDVLYQDDEDLADDTYEEGEFEDDDEEYEEGEFEEDDEDYEEGEFEEGDGEEYEEGKFEEDVDYADMSYKTGKKEYAADHRSSFHSDLARDAAPRYYEEQHVESRLSEHRSRQQPQAQEPVTRPTASSRPGQRITQPLTPEQVAGVPHLQSSKTGLSSRRPTYIFTPLEEAARPHNEAAGLTLPNKNVCPRCKGAGFLRLDVPFGHPNFGKPVACECKETERREKRRQQLREMSNLDAFYDRTFQTFNPRIPGVRQAYEVATRYAQDPSGWLLLNGTNGCGKTHLAAAIAHTTLERGAVVLFSVVADLLDHLRAAFAPTSNEVYDQLFSKMREAEMLILDDLGAHQSSPWATEKLFQILNHRYNLRMPTVITANPRGLNSLDERLRSRVSDYRLVHTVNMDQARDYRSLQIRRG